VNNRWIKRCWIISGAGILIALAPLIPAFLGLMVNSQYLQTYHWYLYFSVPLGLPITLIAGAVALVMTVKGRLKNRKEQNNDE
jgi:hypothetical protein